MEHVQNIQVQFCLPLTAWNKINTQNKTNTSPPNFFTPRFLGFESRPFFVEPAVFLEAQRLNVKLKPSPETSKNKIVGSTNHQSSKLLLKYIIQ